jgi:poly(3-hydroxybutyrate) depolymerase
MQSSRWLSVAQATFGGALLLLGACSSTNETAPTSLGNPSSSTGTGTSTGSGGSETPGSGGRSSIAGSAGTSDNGGGGDVVPIGDASPGGPPASDAAMMMSGGGGRPSGKSAGCTGPAPTDAPQKAIEHDVQVKVADKYAPQYVSRKYYTTLPKNYDPTAPYPVVFYGQGCGQTGPENGPFSNAPYSDQIIYVQLIPAAVTAQTVVPSMSAPGCFEAGSYGLADSPDGPYFDQALAEIEAKYCIDQSKVYVGGWSSGAWLTTYLACSRGNVIRGGVTVAGGLQHDHGTCTGGAAVMMIIGTGDGENPVVNMKGGFDVGTGQARDVLVKANGCTAPPVAWDPMYSTCQIYGGCATPVVWCPVGGGHGAGQDIMAPAAWKLWMGLK